MKRVICSLVSVSSVVILASMVWACGLTRSLISPAPRLTVVLQADLSACQPGEKDNIMGSVISVIKARLDAYGFNKSVVQRQGSDQILVRISGYTGEGLPEAITRLALIEFGELAKDNETAKWENELGRWKPATAVINGQTKELTSEYIQQNTYVTQDNAGHILLMFKWHREGSQLSEAITSRLIGKPLGIFAGDQPLQGEDGRPIAPTVKAVITDSGEIEGLTIDEATALSKQLNAGRLPVPVTVVESHKD
jgi:preprotein translocase subunit SecD